MKPSSGIQNLEQVLHDLKTKHRLNFDEICDLLFTFEYEDFDDVFEISQMAVPPESFVELPVYTDETTVKVMLWGINYCSAIHDGDRHSEAFKILKGSLAAVSYRENENFIEFDSSAVFGVGQVLPEETLSIHSIINNEEEISVSLHIGNSVKRNYEGVRIFDTENRKIAYLSSKAETCAWGLPDKCYTKTVEI